MSRNRFQILETEALVDLHILVTQQLMDAIDRKAPEGEISAKMKELELINEILLERKPQFQLKKKRG